MAAVEEEIGVVMALQVAVESVREEQTILTHRLVYVLVMDRHVLQLLVQCVRDGYSSEEILLVDLVVLVVVVKDLVHLHL